MGLERGHQAVGRGNATVAAVTARYIDCDVCGLPDSYNGDGDGIGSCDCPRCDGGEAAADSVLCTCPPDDYP